MILIAKKYWPLLVLLLCCVVLVWGIDTIPIILWDESLYSVNAIEMLHSGNWNVHYYDGEIDYYNLKPPFFTQLRALSFHLFGYSYWVHRLPSAVFSCLTVCLTYVAARHFTKSDKWALLAAVFLTIAPAYNTLHATKGGEYDVMMTFFMLGYVLSFLRALETNLFKWRFFTILLMGAAFYVKSIAGLFFMPGMMVAIVWYRREWLIERNNWLMIGLFLFFPIIYYGYIYFAVPGYLEAIYHHHFTRFGNTLNDNPLPWYHYLKSPSVLPYYVPSLLLTVFLMVKKVSVPKWIIQAQILVLLFLILISSSATKHGFYTVAIFPVASIVLCYLFYKILALQKVKIISRGLNIGVVFCSIVSLHFTFAKANHYVRYYNRSYPIDYTKQLLSGNVLMKPEANEVNYGEDARIYYNEARDWFEDDKPSRLVVFAKDLHVPNSEGYNPLLMFYVDYWRLEKGMTVDLAVDIQQIDVGDVVLCSELDKLLVLKNKFQLQRLKQSNHCYLYEVKKRY